MLFFALCFPVQPSVMKTNDNYYTFAKIEVFKFFLKYLTIANLHKSFLVLSKFIKLCD